MWRFSIIIEPCYIPGKYLIQEAWRIIMGKINLVLRKTFIKLAIAVLAFVPAVSFTACGNGKDKGTDKEEKPEYVYEADFKELGNMKMDSLSRSCFNDG